ncbi:MAG TPA: right-handed parallel beta-helix repeat-containing protein [Ferruginibacter sp.]|nr:right-handed parallel beta-helix repeat-containing protein [Ferruginibacter sp.]
MYTNLSTLTKRLLLFSVLVMLLKFTNAQNFYVNDNSLTGDMMTTAVGNDANPGTVIAPFRTIQHAINTATAGSVIYIDAGTYNEKLVVNKTLRLQGLSETTTRLDGVGLGVGSGIYINSGITNVVIKFLTVRNHSGTGPNSYAGIYAAGNNNGIQVQTCTIKDNVGGSGFYANGPVNGVILNDLEISGHNNSFGAARGIVIWNGLKQNITISNCTVYNNNCCGIELQDGTATGVVLTNNNVYNNGDNGIGVVGLQGPGANVLSGNTLSNNGRFGMEIKNPNGSGANSGAGSIVVSNNNVSMPGAIADMRDMVGIGVFRRGVLAGNVDIPTGVVVTNNTVAGYTQPTSSDGFGIVIEGKNHKVTGNTVTGNDVGIQRQAGHLPYPGDGDQANLADDFFGRGNSPITCGVSIVSNILSGNGIDYRDVGSVSTSAGIVTNINTGQSYCSIQSAINDALTLAGHTVQVSAGTFVEDVLLNKSIILKGAGQGVTTIVGVMGGDVSTVRINANNAQLSGFSITREGNNLTDWDNPTLNSAGIAMQGAVTGVLIHDNNIYGNRTGIDINNSSGHTIRNNVITNNRTGLIFRNKTDNITFIENEVTDNWTVGIVFLDASGGTNSPVQSALSCNFNYNNISGNWYGQVVDRQTGGALPAPGGNLKNFKCNWWGTITPVISTANSAEPGYSAQIPIAFGGSATAPGGQPDILGAASANIEMAPYLTTGVDANMQTTPGRGIYGFQPSEACESSCALTLSTSSTNAVCPDFSSGTATVLVTSPSISPSYLWNTTPEQTTATAVGLSPGNHSVTVTDLKGCTAEAIVNVGLITATPPAAPIINGITNACPYAGTLDPVVFTIDELPGISSYIWTVPPTVTIVSGQGTNTLTVTIGASFTLSSNKQIRARAIGDCGISPIGIKYLVAQMPVTPNPITGLTEVCDLVGTPSTETYSIDDVTAATSYLWEVPAGATITENNGTNIKVSFGPTFSTGSIKVRALNNCGVSTARSITVKSTIPSTPGPISGPSNPCMYKPSLLNPSGVNAFYSVTKSANVSTYNWILPVGVNLINQSSTPTEEVIEVAFTAGYTSGNISVFAVNNCGMSGIRQRALASLDPGAPSAIDELQTGFCPTREFTYSLSAMPSSALYVEWTIPAGATLVSGQGTSSIVVSYPTSAITGSVTATPSNGCKSSTTRTLNVKLAACAPPMAKNAELLTEFTADVSPNPTQSTFNVLVKSNLKEKVQVRIYDATGKTYNVLQRNLDERISFGEKLKAGVYFVEVQQGKQRKILKVIKL